MHRKPEFLPRTEERKDDLPLFLCHPLLIGPSTRQLRDFLARKWVDLSSAGVRRRSYWGFRAKTFSGDAGTAESRGP